MNEVSSKEINLFISQIIYPRTLQQLKKPAILIGWNIERFHCLIAFAITLPKESYPLVSRALELTYNDKNYFLSKFYGYSYPPMILGEWQPDINGSYLPKSENQAKGIWITLTKDRLSHGGNTIEGIKLHSIFSLGFCYDTSCYMIGYDSVNTDRLESLITETSKQDRVERLKQRFLQSIQVSYPNITSINGNHTISSISNMSNTHRISGFVDIQNKSHGIEEIIILINGAYDLRKFTNFYLKSFTQDTSMIDSYDLKYRSKRFCLSMLRSLSYVVWFYYFSLSIIKSILAWPFPIFNELIKVFSWSELSRPRVSEKPLSPIGHNNNSHFATSPMNNSPSQATSSSTLGSLSSNFKHYLSPSQAIPLLTKKIPYSMHSCSFLMTEITLRCSKMLLTLHHCLYFTYSWTSEPTIRKKLWMSINDKLQTSLFDVLLGLFFTFCCLHFVYFHQLTMFLADFLYQFTNQSLPNTLLWIHDSPLGIKLNTLLTKKISMLLILYFENCYFHILEPLFLYFKDILFIIFYCLGCFGLTFQLSFLLDIWNLYTFPVNILHVLITQLFNFHVQSIYSLFLLFKGQKNNILRNRVDTCIYNREQLLFGVLLFSILIFLLPNFLSYYILFVLLRLGVLLIQFLIWQYMTLIKRFPIYPLTLQCTHSLLLQENAHLVLSSHQSKSRDFFSSTLSSTSSSSVASKAFLTSSSRQIIGQTSTQFRLYARDIYSNIFHLLIDYMTKEWKYLKEEELIPRHTIQAIFIAEPIRWHLLTNNQLFYERELWHELDLCEAVYNQNKHLINIKSFDQNYSEKTFPHKNNSKSPRYPSRRGRQYQLLHQESDEYIESDDEKEKSSHCPASHPLHCRHTPTITSSFATSNGMLFDVSKDLRIDFWSLIEKILTPEGDNSEDEDEIKVDEEIEDREIEEETPLFTVSHAELLNSPQKNKNTLSQILLGRILFVYGIHLLLYCLCSMILIALLLPRLFNLSSTSTSTSTIS